MLNGVHCGEAVHATRPAWVKLWAMTPPRLSRAQVRPATFASEMVTNSPFCLPYYFLGTLSHSTHKVTWNIFVVYYS